MTDQALTAELARLRDEGVLTPTDATAIHVGNEPPGGMQHLNSHLSVDGVPVSGRSPVMVFLLALVTSGLYSVYWYFVTNREVAMVLRQRKGRSETFSPLLWTMLILPYQLLAFMLVLRVAISGFNSWSWSIFGSVQLTQALSNGALGSLQATFAFLGTLGAASIAASIALPVMAMRVNSMQTAMSLPEERRLSMTTFWCMYFVWAALGTTIIGLVAFPLVIAYLQHHLTCSWQGSPRRLRVV